MLSVATRAELAADLAQAERSRVPLDPLTAAHPDIDVVDAYEIQLINIRQRVAEGANPAWRTLASNAYGIYYVHPLILYPLAYLLLDLDAPALVKVTVLVVVTLGASLGVSALVLRRLPGLRRVF